MNKNINILRKQLLFRSNNRGCKETDYIFGDFAINEISKLTVEELHQYESLLNVDDLLLYNWFNGLVDTPKEYYTSVYKKIIKFNEERFKNL